MDKIVTIGASPAIQSLAVGIMDSVLARDSSALDVLEDADRATLTMLIGDAEVGSCACDSIPNVGVRVGCGIDDDEVWSDMEVSGL